MTIQQLFELFWREPEIADFDPTPDIDDTILQRGDVVTVLGTSLHVGELRGEIVDVDFENAPYCYRVETCVFGDWQAMYYTADELEKIYN